MRLRYRLVYFSGGFLVGILLLFFILSGKETSCDYGPEARTLKNIRQKELVFTESSLENLRKNQLDSTAVLYLLDRGDVLFSESETHRDSCNRYIIQGEVSKKMLKIEVENCNKVATIQKTTIQN